jgi:hypothetical protein
MYIPRNPYFSEFSYGYALTENLVTGQGSSVTVAPIFPSLIEEGQVGFDVLIARPSIPLFLQFKLAHRMSRRSAWETQRGDFDPPFYRMHLRCTAISNQHSLLLALEQEGNEVFYAAPAFHTRAQLNEAYSQGQVWNRSFTLRPSEIGPLADGDHHVAFQFPGHWQSYSEEPHGKGGETSDPRNIIAHFEMVLRERNPPPLKSRIERLDRGLLKIVTERRAEVADWRAADTLPLEQHLTPLRRVSYLARHFFDCQLFVATEKAGVSG